MSKISIVSISTIDGRTFSIEGEAAGVKEIVYKRNGNLYNSGFQTGVPGYVVKLEDNPDRVILIPEHAVSEIIVDKKQEEANIIPELPDADVTAG